MVQWYKGTRVQWYNGTTEELYKGKRRKEKEVPGKRNQVLGLIDDQVPSTTHHSECVNDVTLKRNCVKILVSF